MPIGDLLAQISGDKSDPGSGRVLQRTSSVPTKRKPDNEFLGSAPKTPRTGPSPPTSSVKSGKAAPQPPQYTGNARPRSALSSRPISSVTRSATNVAASRPAAPPAPAVARGPPKKGSFAEILARGQRAQAVMGQVGKIQHKKVEKGAAKKIRDEPPPPAAAAAAAGSSSSPSKGRVTGGGYSGTAKPGQRNGAVNGHKALAQDARQGGGRPPSRPIVTGRSKAQAAAEEEEAAKKLKKAAQATTGYTGTARPKPDKTARKRDAPRGGALLNAPRHTSSKNSRFEDDYDEELDDFIEYDDEEAEEGGPRYGYASDGSSDMEAGLDDIDHEERRAEYIGRQEDQQEERLEKSLKAAKEARKRRALEDLRARRR